MGLSCSGVPAKPADAPALACVGSRRLVGLPRCYGAAQIATNMSGKHSTSTQQRAAQSRAHFRLRGRERVQAGACEDPWAPRCGSGRSAATLHSDRDDETTGGMHRDRCEPRRACSASERDCDDLFSVVPLPGWPDGESADRDPDSARTTIARLKHTSAGRRSACAEAHGLVLSAGKRRIKKWRHHRSLLLSQLRHCGTEHNQPKTTARNAHSAAHLARAREAAAADPAAPRCDSARNAGKLHER
jgi:hypothetical protein